ncbi:MAG: putative phosphoribosyl transferase [Actinomycetota bacterium]|nr:putative phosphoribosyl transferase [Actinomycetota bacterium]
MARRYVDRRHAGTALAERLAHLADDRSVLVLGLPRGGVPVAAEVARVLGSPLDVFLVRKLGVPGREELAMGAIASGGVLTVNDDVVAALNISDTMMEVVVAREHKELARREHLYRGDRPQLDLKGKTVVLVDDGLATGATMRAAVASAKLKDAGKTIVAVPVGAPQVCAELAQEADEVVSVLTPGKLIAVGFWYQDFSQVTDDEVSALLETRAG